MMSTKALFDGRARRPVCLAMAVFLASLVVGCGSGGSPCSVSGEVTFEGQPVVDGNIRFNPVGGTPGPGASAKIKDGKYQIPTDQGMLAGKHVVLITATRSTGRMIKIEESLGSGPAEREEIVQYVPDRYNRKRELTYEATPGENTKDFPLTK